MGGSHSEFDWGLDLSWEEILERLHESDFAQPEQTEPNEELAVPCPTCGATGVIPLVFGLPGPELVEKSRRGLVSLPG